MTCTLKAIAAINTLEGSSWAQASNCSWGIGAHGKLLTHKRGDLLHFKELTLGHPVIMGRKTLESLPGGRPLDGRRNIVLTRNTNFSCSGAEVVHSAEEALAAVVSSEEAWVIGGGEIYKQFLPYTSEAHITVLEIERSADTFFPNLEANPDWEQNEIKFYKNNELPFEETTDGNGLPLRFITYRRITGAQQIPSE